MKIFALVKKYRESSKYLIPRSVFMFLLFLLLVIFASSIFTGVGFSLLSMLGKNFLLALFSFVALEFFFAFFAFVLHYGLFLSNLRFVRSQPVALTFLFTGFKQKRAKKFAVFFVFLFIAAFIIAMIPAVDISFEQFPQSSDPQAILDYFSEHPEFYKAAVYKMLLLFAAAFVLYMPFVFAWPIVYDGIKTPFGKLFSKTLEFWKGKFLNFWGFEICVHYKNVILIALCNSLEVLILKHFSSKGVAQVLSSLLGFVGFLATIVFFASAILSINFYYDMHCQSEEKNENSEQGNSN